jgi:hypothetical protein
MTHPDDRPPWPAVIPALLLVVSLVGASAVVVRARPAARLLWGRVHQSTSSAEFPRAPLHLDDPRLNSLRLAAEHWKTSLESKRVVVDQVCLVTDVAAFLAAIAQWDERQFFPILIDEPALTLPFLRAFRPARVIRYHSSRAQPNDSDELEKLPLPASRDEEWAQALEAVARAWSNPGVADHELPVATSRPGHVGPTPPAVVLTGPEAPMLAGAVALAAGRFQPLIRAGAVIVRVGKAETTPVPRTFADVLTIAEARVFARAIEARVAKVVPRYDRLDDDCDFLTLAGDWPYRYSSDAQPGPASGVYAVDDLVGRILPDPSAAGWLSRARRRWAYTGRLTGDPAESVYRAMSSLFLEPESALFWNTYEGGTPWSLYAMGAAADFFSRQSSVAGAVVYRSGRSADVAGWHRAVTPANRFGLIFLNSAGGPRLFAMTGGPGRPADLPSGMPAAVTMIHSFSAADLTDRQTIAGRWLAQGAFVFFGSVYEPFLLAFRPPRLVAELIEAGAPLAAGLRQGESEPFGFPWRLLYLGDPLYRPWVPRGQTGPSPVDGQKGAPPPGARMSAADWRELAPEYAQWPATAVTVRHDRKSPSSGRPSFVSEDDRLRWCVDAAIVHLMKRSTQDRPVREGDRPHADPDQFRPVDWLPELRAVRRLRLSPRLKSVFDDLLIDSLEEIGALAELQARLAAIPAAECGPRVWLAMERCAMGRLAALAGGGSSSGTLSASLDLWDEVIRLPWPKGCEFPAQLTERLSALIAVDPARRRRPWLARLSRAAAALAAEPGRFFHATVVEAEQRRTASPVGGRAEVNPGSR